jgi:hypothetical protein
MITETTKQWALSVIDASSFEFDTLMARIPPSQRAVVGELKKWSPKDQVAHLIYWIDLFAANLRACRGGFGVVSTADYLAMNDAAWPERKDWAWPDVETNLVRMFSDVRAQVQELNSEDLTDARRYSVETAETGPKPILQSLVYELIEHPIHHFVRIYRVFEDRVGVDSLLARAIQVTNQSDVLSWSEPTLKQIQELIEQNRTA